MAGLVLPVLTLVPPPVGRHRPWQLESARLMKATLSDRTKAHGKENPPTFYVVRLPSPTRALSPRQLPTDHDNAVSTRGYQTDQPSHWPLVLSPARPFSSKQARLNLGLDTVAPYQKISFNPNWIWREVVTVFVITP